MTGPAEPAAGLVREVRLRGMRGAVAGAMLASIQGSAQLTLNRDLEVGPLLELRRGLQDRPSINTLLMVAVARALARRPDVNATLEDKVIRQWGRVDLGFAAAVENGLVVPVVRAADTLSVKEMADEIGQLAEKARTGTLKMTDLTDGTFTVTNLGGYGIDHFTPIINLPQVAILGVGRVRGDVLTASLTIDHRALDGAPGATFLGELNEVLASPEALLDPAR